MRGRSSAGFTLVEALISLALVALMLTMLPASLQLGRRAWQGAAAIEARQNAEVLRDLIRTKISSAVPAFGRDEKGIYQLAFAGRPDAISFVVDDSEDGLSGYLRYVIEADATNRYMTLRREPFDAFARQPARTASEVVLTRDLHGLQFRYFGTTGNVRAKSPSTGEWQSEWVARDTLPRLVEVEIISPTLGGPAIIAEIKLN